MKKIKTIIIILISIILIIIYARFIATSGLITKEYTIYSDKLPYSYNGLKIVHFSDLHYGSVITSKRLKQIVDEINLINPDIVIFTGDLLDKSLKTDDKIVETISKQLKSISAKYGKYTIMGNHDYEENKSEIEKIYKNSNFTLLNNQYDIIINKEKDKIYLGGIDDTLLGNPDIKSTTSYLKENNDTYSIILVHEPDYSTNILKEQEVDLILSGHSHNGQVRIPIIGALYTPNGAKKYYKNHYTINDTELYISSGIGNTDLNLRLFNRPSINFYRINTKKDS